MVWQTSPIFPKDLPFDTPTSFKLPNNSGLSVCLYLYIFFLLSFFDEQNHLFKITSNPSVLDLTSYSSKALFFATLCIRYLKKTALMFRTFRQIRGCAIMNEFFPLNIDCALEVYDYFPFILYFHEKRRPVFAKKIRPKRPMKASILKLLII